SYLAALRSPNGSLNEFGRNAFLDRANVSPTTPDDEAMIAGLDLLRNYVGLLQTSWNNYYNKRQAQPNSLPFPLFKLRLQRASVMLPGVGEGTNNFMSAMDSVGFTEHERRSQSAKFTQLAANPQQPLGLPDITVGHLTDELDRISNVDGPAYLAD